MTSDADDLEEALRENLKLRRELAAHAAAEDAANLRGGLVYHLGSVLYGAIARTWSAVRGSS